MGNVEKRIEDLERRLGPRKHVVIRLVEDGPPGREREDEVEVGRFTLYHSEGEDHSPEEPARA